ncbi:MAG: anaerobic sulfite reductase subunit AsrB, partial [Candidatus Pacearchaeota archaeon]|nr:anaerobic sulfite reductase subunit AsrB [Candidatus Pacearchaeota archaeon]
MTYLPKKYKILSVKEYTSDVRLFKIKCNLNPLPGHFIEVSIPGIGECPLASCSYNKNEIDILLRNAGNTTSSLFQKKKNDEIFIRGPYGKGFPIELLEKKNLILIAGGTGIAPITSFISYIEQNRKKFGEIFIYFGFRDEENILLNDRIKNWKKKFHVYIGLSNDPDTKKYETGY